MARQPNGVARAGLHGDNYDPIRDHKRLGGQVGRVYNAMRDGVYRSLSEIALMTNLGEASINVQLRNLKKKEFGGFQIFRRSRHERNKGFWEYRVCAPAPKENEPRELFPKEAPPVGEDPFLDRA